MTVHELNSNVIQIERSGHILTLRINRPEARNAIDLATAIAIGEALDQADQDIDVRVVIVTGAGEQAFCAGADLKALAAGQPIIPADARASRGFAGLVSHSIAKPLIAAVNGFALGGGTEIALACDLVVASETASFGLPEVKRGIMAAAGGAFRLVQQLPRKIAMEMLLTGDAISAQRALELGLVNAVVPQAEVMGRAIALAERIAVNAPLSVQASKRVARGWQEELSEAECERWRLSRREMAKLLRSRDAQEGPRAFAEKRAPTWQGH